MVHVEDNPKYDDLFRNIATYKDLASSNEGSKDDIRQIWGESRIETFQNDLNKFVKESSSKSMPFQYWSQFLDQVVPVLKDLTLSFREGEWSLHLSAIRRAIPLFFSFDRTNYCRWTPLYFDDCIKLENTFPALYENFMSGNFNVRHTQRKCSAVPMDQRLEK